MKLKDYLTKNDLVLLRAIFEGHKDIGDSDLEDTFERLYKYYEPEMPYQAATGDGPGMDPYQWVMYRLESEDLE